MKIRLTNLSGALQVSTQLGNLAPNQSLIVDVDTLDKYSSELNSLVSAGLISAAILSSAPKTVDADVITKPLTLYVSTTGSDLNPGTLTQPFASIQAALNSLSYRPIQSKVTISVGVGSFRSFTIDGSLLKFPTISNHISPYITAGGLDIVGTWVAPTLASGTASGTASGALVNLAAVLTDAGQSWTVNDLRGKYLLSGSVYYPIISNTATTITVPNTSALSGAYSIWDHGTIVDTDTASIGSIGGTQTGRIAIQNLMLGASTSVTISGIRFSLDGMASGTAGVAMRTSTATFENISVVRTSSSITISGFSIGTTDQVTLVRCHISFPSTLGNAITSSNPHRFLNVVKSYIRNGSTAISSAPGSQVTQIQATTFEGMATGVQSTTNTVNSLLGSNRFITCTTALSIGLSTSSAASTLVMAASNTIYFDTCTTILSASNASMCGLGVVSGTGNTNGLVLTKGARCQIANTAALGAATELSVDGTTGTLVALRAASPRVFPAAANPYSTYVYE